MLCRNVSKLGLEDNSFEMHLLFEVLICLDISNPTLLVPVFCR